jgi:thiopurine S-methyltransferase
MDANFWHHRWETKQIGFHLSETNPWLVKYLPTFRLNSGARIFIPLCGKTLDIAYLLGQGFQVVGVELSELAIEQLFQELKVTPEISKRGAFKRYYHAGLTIYVGDFFSLTRVELGEVQGIYDRAALVALPPEMRVRYAAHMQKLAPMAPQLLITFDYDQSGFEGPPFSVSEAEVRALYAHKTLAALAEAPVAGGLRGYYPAQERVWMLG